MEPEPAHPAPPDPEPEPEQVGGVDITLIRWMLSLTPAKRLQVLQNNVNAILRLRERNPQLRRKQDH